MNSPRDTAELRATAHKFLDRLLDALAGLEEFFVEMQDEVEGRAPVQPAPAEKPTTPQKVAHRALFPNRDRPGPVASEQVRVGAGPVNGTVRCRIYIPADLGGRAGLKLGDKCIVVRVGDELHLSPSGGGATLSRSGTTDRLLLYVPYGPADGEKHAAEVAQNWLKNARELVVRRPPWWPLTPAHKKAPCDDIVLGLKERATKSGRRKPIRELPDLHCGSCGGRATLECCRCHDLVCDACWKAHVRTHWDQHPGLRSPSRKPATTEVQP